MSVTSNGVVDVATTLVSATLLFTSMIDSGVVVFATVGVEALAPAAVVAGAVPAVVVAGAVPAVVVVVVVAGAVVGGTVVAGVVVAGVVVDGGVVTVEGTQLGWVNTSLSRVTAPVWANALP